MTMLDVFNADAFSVVQLTDSINKLKFVPGRLGQLGLFQETGVAVTTVVIEERDGILSLVSPSPRGGPGQTLSKQKRTARPILVPHFEINDAVMAEEVQGVRAWGSESELQTVMSLVGDRLQIHTQSHAATQEYSRIGAIKGVVTYADGSTLDLFSTFGVSAQSTAHLDLENATPAEGALRKAVTGIARTIYDELGGTPVSGLRAECGNTFFDDLIAHPEVRETFKNQVEASQLRQAVVTGSGSLIYGAFEFAGIVWENYRGKVGTTDFVDTNLAQIYPEGVPGLFRTYYAPADYMETVNTIGQRRYAKQYPMDNGKGVNLDSQMNALDICTRPRALVTATKAA
jgi:hypothetical protein